MYRIEVAYDNIPILCTLQIVKYGIVLMEYLNTLIYIEHNITSKISSLCGGKQSLTYTPFAWKCFFYIITYVALVSRFCNRLPIAKQHEAQCVSLSACREIYPLF